VGSSVDFLEKPFACKIGDKITVPLSPAVGIDIVWKPLIMVIGIHSQK
jgi:hypothetical protein